MTEEIKKVCPFMNGLLLIPVVDKVPVLTKNSQVGFQKDFTIMPCQEGSCKFYNDHFKECEIILAFQNLSLMLVSLQNLEVLTNKKLEIALEEKK